MLFSIDNDSLKKSEDFLLSCMDIRIDELSMEYINSDEYLEFYERYTDIIKELKESLSSEAYKQIMTLDSLFGNFTSENQNYFYKNGFKDCRIFFTLLNK